MRRNIIFLIIISLLVSLPACYHRSHILCKKIYVDHTKNNSCSLVPSNPPPLTIWIHGTRFIRRPFADIDTFTTTGLKKITEIPPHTSSYKLIHLLSENNHHLFPRDTFYAFRWSGNITNQARLEAAKQLYDALQPLIQDYINRWKQYPVIQLITHSHGGNVALLLATIGHEHSKAHPLVIHTLVLLACPVQNNTMQLAQQSTFKHIYSFYSTLDLVQVIAPQKFVGILPFSSRRFPHFDNIVQAKIRLNGHAIFHTSFIKHRFFKSLPFILTELQNFIQSPVYHQNKHKHLLLRVNTRQKNVRPYKRKKLKKLITT